ncbi:uncharacterized protein B0H18DRAFT_1037814 [Fomitopsis serialis]|uniref:uncharacterized protein n=1 Tax=Fomitopsis serialis TaxID=139415 RepID=UPI0020085FA1|nr:uncharacterized protein B0H18DRAFT_1037814 [Neoantrodia serialis]KAH9916633.1 hypothetical protein B0H18DRAFT_1037814 [Neoantrodia serialis]
MYAINGRNKWTPSVTMALAFVPVAINVRVFLVDKKWTASRPPDCIIYEAISNTTTCELEIITRVCSIVADSLVLIETWRHTYGINKLARGLTTKPSVTSLLLRDGTTYFCVLLTVNIGSTALCAKNLNLTIEFENFYFVLTTILLSRFFLNLREIYLLPDPGSNSSTFSDIRFADALNKLGGSLAQRSDDPEGALGISNLNGASTFDIDEEGEFPESERNNFLL